MEEDDEDQALEALLAVMFTDRSVQSTYTLSRHSSAAGDEGDLESELETGRSGLRDGAEPRSRARMPTVKRPTLSEHQIVTFDVGGQVFRCRAGLILRFPAKRLAQLITCGCARMQNDEASFFIDRNPTHFQRILDWYRSPADSTAPLVPKDRSFQEDARYFDLYDEFFPFVSMPSALPVPPRPSRQQIEAALSKAAPNASKPMLQRPTSLQELTTKPLYPVSKPVHGLKPSKSIDMIQQENPQKETPIQSCKMPIHEEGEDGNKVLQFVKREYWTLTSDTTPCIYAVRKGEELHVARVKGFGRLLLRVCDSTGMKQLHVAQAVLFDSQSCFYAPDKWIPLGQQGHLPGDHTYTFWVESFSLEPNDTGSAVSKNSMQVEFKLLSSFHWNQRADNDAQSRGFIPETPALVSSDSGAFFSPLLMLPPQPQHHPVLNTKARNDSPEKQRILMQTNQHESLDNYSDASRDVIADRIFRFEKKSPEKRQSIVWKNAQKPKTTSIAAQSPSSSAIKRNGAAIALGSPQRHLEDRQTTGNMTIYHPEKLVMQERDLIPSSIQASRYHDLQPRSFY